MWTDKICRDNTTLMNHWSGCTRLIFTRVYLENNKNGGKAGKHCGFKSATFWRIYNQLQHMRCHCLSIHAPCVMQSFKTIYHRHQRHHYVFCVKEVILHLRKKNSPKTERWNCSSIETFQSLRLETVWEWAFHR